MSKVILETLAELKEDFGDENAFKMVEALSEELGEKEIKIIAYEKLQEKCDAQTRELMIFRLSEAEKNDAIEFGLDDGNHYYNHFVDNFGEILSDCFETFCENKEYVNLLSISSRVSLLEDMLASCHINVNIITESDFDTAELDYYDGDENERKQQYLDDIDSLNWDLRETVMMECAKWTRETQRKAYLNWLGFDKYYAVWE